MDSAFTHTQEALGRAARKLYQAHCNAETIRQLYSGHRSIVKHVWQLTAERGFLGALAPKSFGGAGLEIVDVVPILQEAGRALAPGPLVETMALAAPLINSVGTQAQKERWLPMIATGKTAVSLALAEMGGIDSPAGIRARAIRQGSGFSLTGVETWVADADVADLLLVPARTDDNSESGVTLFLIPADAHDIAVESLVGMDRTKHYSRIRFDSVKVESNAVLGEVGEGWPPLAMALDIATVSICSTMVGGAERALEMASEYAKTRQQYGTTIGKFQGIKHKCAEMFVQLESAKAATYYAAWALSTSQPNAVEAVSIAKNYVSQAYSYICSENVQIHGALGFTWESEVHWYLKRAKSNEVQFGSPRFHRERLATILGW